MADAMRYFVLLLLLLSSLPAQEVEHALTVEQCRADQRLWFDKLESQSPLPDFHTLSAWGEEMRDCIAVDPPNHKDYYNVFGEVASAKLESLEGFLIRHDLWDKFIEEDKAGKR
ncbi:MAG: hypothetical protein WBQ10_08005 [Terriglobales bacterium]